MLIAKLVVFVDPLIQAVAFSPEVLVLANQIGQALEFASDFNRTHIGFFCCVFCFHTSKLKQIAYKHNTFFLLKVW